MPRLAGLWMVIFGVGCAGEDGPPVTEEPGEVRVFAMQVGEPVGDFVALPAGGVAPYLATFRVITPRRVSAESVERVTCMCFESCGTGAASVAHGGCAACGDDPATGFDESGRCLDVNNDRIPDRVELQPRVARIVCAGVPRFGDGGTYESAGGEGYRVGHPGTPADLVIEPGLVLPSGSRCSFALTSLATDEDGASFAGDAIIFDTAPLAAAIPREGPLPGSRSLEVRFTAPVARATLDGRLAVRRLRDGAELAIRDVSVDGRGVHVELDAELEESEHEVTVVAGVTDGYDVPLAETAALRFTPNDDVYTF